MGDFGADTLRDSIEAAWALTGRLTKTATATNKEVVEFFAHPQIRGAGEFSKAIEVKKINTDESENITRHPRFEEVSDIYEITIRYRLLGGDEILYDQAEEDVEDMCEEVIRTVRTIYNPFTGTGVFWNKASRWRFDDKIDGKQTKMELRRIMRIELTRVNSQSTEVFTGYGGVLTFDLSGSSNMNSAPAGDYIYTEAYSVQRNEGSQAISIMTRNSSSGTGRAAKFRGEFVGNFTCQMMAKKSDLNGATADKLDNIYKAQANGEHILAAFLDASTNREGTVSTLTDTIVMRVTNIRKSREDEDLVKYTLTADLDIPTVSAVTP